MAFRPNINDTLLIDGVIYRIAAHPSAPGMPYGQTGRRATVYQLLGATPRALKVFTPAFRTPRTAQTAIRLAPFASLPGLQVCRRTVLTPQTHAALLDQQPDLSYAALMPWVEGATWQELMLDSRPLSQDICQRLAVALASILSTAERNSIAHCDLSAANVLVTTNPVAVALVDVEDLYAPGLERPEKLPGGSPDYSHKTAPAGLWSAEADRFAGAVLLAEVLAWCDERVRRAAHGEQFFDPDEIQQASHRYDLLHTVLQERWGRQFAGTLAEAWNSTTLDRCPPLTAWAELLANQPERSVRSDQEPARASSGGARERLVRANVERAEALLELGQLEHALSELKDAYGEAPNLAASAYARALLARAAAQEQAGNLSEALEGYRAARQVAPAGSLRDELDILIDLIEAKLASALRPTPLHCTRCSREVQAEWVRCPYCEEPLGRAVGISRPPEADRPPRRRPIWMIALIVLLLFGGVSVAGMLVTGGLAASTPTPNALAALPTRTILPIRAATAAPTAEPTALPTATAAPSATTVPPTATVQPTETALPTTTPLRPTATLLPPTATPRPATATPLPPTATPRPATATPNQAATEQAAAQPLDIEGFWRGQTSQGREISFYVRHDTYYNDGVNRLYIDGINTSAIPQNVITGSCETIPVQGFNMWGNFFLDRDFDVNVQNSGGIRTNLYGMRGRFDKNSHASGTFYLDFTFPDCRATVEVSWNVTK
jgi:tetratricopeptide (TPR) repeat protein